MRAELDRLKSDGCPTSLFTEDHDGKQDGKHSRSPSSDTQSMSYFHLSCQYLTKLTHNLYALELAVMISTLRVLVRRPMGSSYLDSR